MAYNSESRKLGTVLHVQVSVESRAKLILLDSLLQEAEHVARLYFQIAG